MKKRILAVVALVMLIGSCLSEMAAAEVLGDYTYEIISDDSVRIVKYTGNAEKLDIPLKLAGYSIVEIGKGAFRGNQHLTSVSIPGRVRFVGDDAFSNCDNLKEFILKEGITDITGWSEDIFDCHYTRSTEDDPFLSVTIPNSLSKFSIKPFSGGFTHESSKKFAIQSHHCISKIIISPDNPYYMLKGNSLLTKDGKELICVVDSGSVTSYTVPKGVEIIDEYLLSGNIRLKSLTIPKGVTTINEFAFYSCAFLTSLSLPDTLVTIGDNAFNTLHSLKNLKIPKSVKTIGINAFAGCNNLTSIVIPDGVMLVGEGAFRGCFRATKLTISASIGSISDEMFIGCRALKSVTIPEGITAIGSGAFRGCVELKKVIIPDTVTSIGEGAFSYCEKLENLIIPAGVEFIGENAFSNCPNLTLTVVPGSYAEEYCIENGVNYINPKD